VSARDEVLGRVRTALAAAPGSPGGPPPGGPPPGGPPPGTATAYRTCGELGAPALLDLLADRLTDYRSQVRRTSPAQVPGTVRAALAGRGARRIVLPPGLDLPGLDQPHPGQPGSLDGVSLFTDGGLAAQELDSMDGVITRAAVAIAETGTIVLDGGPGQGRRALSLIPDYHLCLIDAGQVVALVPEAMARLTPGRPLTWISGPSATSDIELDRVEGVHGPRTLEVILIG
jgi:L-lactate dehydrogenase complex protein LldG